MVIVEIIEFMTDKKIDILFLEICNDFSEKGFYKAPQINYYKGMPLELIEKREILSKISDELQLVSISKTSVVLTEKGKEIHNQGGWMSYLANQKNTLLKEEALKTRRDVQEELIRRGTIEKFRYDKYAFVISIIAVLIALFALITK